MRTPLRLTQRFSGPLYVNEKMERKRISRLWSDRAGTVGKRSWGGEEETRGGGGEGEAAGGGLRLAWGLGRGGQR